MMWDVFVLLWTHVVISCLVVADELYTCSTKRWATEQGFHRKVWTEVGVDFKQTSLLDARPCDLQLVEHLPSGAYVDVYQIRATSDLRVRSDDPVDVEAPAHLSAPHTVRVFSVLRPGGSATGTGAWNAAMPALPVHLRYHRPVHHAAVPGASGAGATVLLEHPEILLRCNHTTGYSGPYTQAPCDETHSERDAPCDWIKLTCSKSQLEALEFRVPVGNLDDTLWVVVTTAVCVLTVISLLGVAMYNHRFVPVKVE